MKTLWAMMATVVGVGLCFQAPAQAKNAEPAAAPKMDLTAKSARSGYVKVDGFVTDWEGVDKVESRTLTRGEPEYDWTGPKDLSMVVQAQYDQTYIYMAVEVRDNIVTGPKRRDRGDRVEIWFDGGEVAAKSPHGRMRMLELALGEMESDGKPAITWQYPKSLKGQEPTGLLKDGSMRHTGYFFEFGLPLSELSDPAPGLEPIGIAIIARDLDRDDPNEDEAAVANAPFDGRKKRRPDTMAKLRLAGAENMDAGFYQRLPELHGVKPTDEFLVDVGGDSRRERVFLVKNRLVVVGFGLGDGDFYYYTMATADHITHHKLETRDLTGDGKDEMLVYYKLDHGPVVQDVLIIFQFKLDRLLVIFHHELGNQGQGWEINNKLTIKGGKKKPAVITVTAPKKVSGVTAETYIDVDQNDSVDWERLLLPWTGPPKNTFEWDVGQYLKR